ncbi:hypothetical protein HK098_002599 [Nowakowskiella sp. JEL0407]|nr:hypothetical protein HK098_002599 [Nowakowskiella sp. JEL0407]
MSALELITRAIVNFLFGFFLQKGRVYEPKLIQDQMLLTDFSMMSMFLGGAGTTALIVGKPPPIIVVSHSLNRVSNADAMHLGISLHLNNTWGEKVREARKDLIEKQGSQGLLSAAIGAGLVGTGMSISGACPGTLYSQLGSGVSGSLYVLAGAIFGTYTFFLIERFLKKRFNQTWLFNEYSSLSENEENRTRFKFSFPIKTAIVILGVVLLTVSALFQLFAPLSKPSLTAQGTNIFTQQAWPPIVSGILIGILQIPTIYINNAPIGMSSLIISIVSLLKKPLTLLHILPTDSKPATWSYITAITKLLDIGFVILGSFASAALSGTLTKIPGLTSDLLTPNHPYVLGFGLVGAAIQAFIGGFVLILGARLADGCTSGHGLSGFAFLAANSVIAVPSIFAGGIATIYVLRALSSLSS